MKNFGIYRIFNKITGDFYVGSTTVSFSARWSAHRSSFKRNKGCPILQNAWKKYGEVNFEFEILEILTHKELVIPREQFYLDFLKPKYNCCPIAGNQTGRKYTPEQRLNASIIHKNEKDNSGRFKKGFTPSTKGKRENRLCACGRPLLQYTNPQGHFKAYRKTCGAEICKTNLREKARLLRIQNT